MCSFEKSRRGVSVLAVAVAEFLTLKIGQLHDAGHTFQQSDPYGIISNSVDAARMGSTPAETGNTILAANRGHDTIRIWGFSVLRNIC